MCFSSARRINALIVTPPIPRCGFNPHLEIVRQANLRTIAHDTPPSSGVRRDGAPCATPNEFIAMN
jgi:hypothetical protein